MPGLQIDWKAYAARCEGRCCSSCPQRFTEAHKLIGEHTLLAVHKVLQFMSTEADTVIPAAKGGQGTCF
eukprot:1158611-Pelagomonas_calceolata.AAC.6